MPADPVREAADLIDQIAARVHDAWMAEKRAAGIVSRPSEDGIEQMVPYADLPEHIKDLDRATVRATLDALMAAGYSIAPPGSVTVVLPEPRGYDRSGMAYWHIPRADCPLLAYIEADHRPGCRRAAGYHREMGAAHLAAAAHLDQRARTPAPKSGGSE